MNKEFKVRMLGNERIRRRKSSVVNGRRKCFECHQSGLLFTFLENETESSSLGLQNKQNSERKKNKKNTKVDEKLKVARRTQD